MRSALLERWSAMFPIIFRVLTIAGSCTIAALLTRRYLQRKAEEQNRFREDLRPKVTEGESSRSDGGESVARAKHSAASGANSGSSEPVSGTHGSSSASEKPLAQPAATPSAEPVSEIELARRKREEALATARQAKNEKVAKAKEAAAAAQRAVEARRRSGTSGSFPAVPHSDTSTVSTELSEAAIERAANDEPSAATASSPNASSVATELSEAATEKVLEQDFSPSQAESVNELALAAATIAEAVETEKKEEAEKLEVDPAEERAKVVLHSSKQILENYKQPDGVKVDLSLAQFSIETAERLVTQSRFEEAFEKASAVGLIVGMAEMRAAIETQLKAMKSNEGMADKVKSVRSILNAADAALGSASQSFISDDVPVGEFMNHLQTAFQKTMQAQNELMNVSV